MKEKEVEKYLVRRAEEKGGKAFKFLSPGCSGVPDRIVVLPGGRIGFLELKAPGKNLRPEQEYRIRQLEALGCTAGAADSPEAAERFLCCLEAGYRREGI